MKRELDSVDKLEFNIFGTLVFASTLQMIIFYIDDDPEDTDFFREAVDYLNDSDLLESEKEKIICVTANNGRKAVDLLVTQEQLPDLIFLDVNMPEMNGKECLNYLKTTSKYSRIPVVMFSTTITPHNSKEFATMGAHECIQKPSKFNDLVKIVSGFVYKTLELR